MTFNSLKSRKDCELREAINQDHGKPSKFQYLNETYNDRWIIEYVFPGKTEGYFVEAGAANGKDASSCYLLETELNWQGVCIEPHPAFIELVPQHRPNSIHEAVCLSDKSEVVSFIVAKGEEGPYLSGIKQNLEKYKWEGDKVVEGGSSIEIPAVPLEEILRKHNAPKVIDYAAFDIEGSEVKVIESFPFEEYRFSAISVESDDWTWEVMLKRLKQFGYIETRNPFCDKTWEKYCVHESIWDESFAAPIS